jgi:hypothetical protein
MARITSAKDVEFEQLEKVIEKIFAYLHSLVDSQFLNDTLLKVIKLVMTK